MKKGCLGCLSVLAIVTVSLVALVAVRVWVSKVRWEGGVELSTAAQAGDLERVNELLGFGRRWLVDVNAGALSEAAGGGHDEVVRRLIAAGAEMNRFPLIEAARGGHATTAAILLEAGADPNAVNYPSSVENAVYNVLGFWLGGQRQWKNYVNPSYYPAALHTAIEHGHTDVAAVLIRAGANVLEPGPPVEERRGGTRMTAVEKARFFGQADMVALLDTAAELPLAINVLNAAQTSDWERLSRLVALGVDVNAREFGENASTRFWTAVNFASRAGRGDIVALLLDHGATLHAFDMGTALVAAARSGDSLAVAALLRAGAADSVQVEQLYWASAESRGGARALLDSAHAARRSR